MKTANFLTAMAYASFIVMSLTACTDTCDTLYHPKYSLADCQKKVGNFKKGATTHYEHSEGFEFDLTVTEDSTYVDNWSDFCVEAESEDRSVQLTSTYPIMSVYINFWGGTEKDSSGVYLNYKSPMDISYSGTSYSVELDSTGNPTESGIEGDVAMLDTITFNGVRYDSVFVIMDYGHYNALNYNDSTFANGELAHLYFSKTKGILKFETTDGMSFTIKEGDDDE